MGSRLLTWVILALTCATCPLYIVDASLINLVKADADEKAEMFKQVLVSSDDANEDDGTSSVGSVTADGTVSSARGGTELMSEGLTARLPASLLERFNLIKSRVREVSKDKPNILWLHDLPNDPESAHFANPASLKRFEKIVFVSSWQQQVYEQMHGKLPANKAVVIRNAIVPFPKSRRTKTGDEPLRLIYHTTPHRGLEILIPVFETLYDAHNGRIILDVYSSFSMYGWAQRDEPYMHLFKRCKDHPGCNYHGAVSNHEVRKALTGAHIFAFPSIWPETSCLAAIEALSAGVEVVCSSLAVLPETTGGFASMYEFTDDKKIHAERFSKALNKAIEQYWTSAKRKQRRKQQVFASVLYSWGEIGFSGRSDEWIQLLGQAHEDYTDTHKITALLADANVDESFTAHIDTLCVAARTHEVAPRVTHMPAGMQHWKQPQEQAMMLYEKVLKLDPKNKFALLAFGNMLWQLGESTKTPAGTERGIEMLEFALDEADALTPSPLDLDSDAYYGAAVRSGFYREQHNGADIAYMNFGRAERSNAARDDCWTIYYATSVPHFPESDQHAARYLHNYRENIAGLLTRDDLYCQNIGSVANPFPIAFYYDGLNYRDELSKWVQLKTVVWPELLYRSPALTLEEDTEYVNSRAAFAVTKELRSRRVKVGVVSSFFSKESSIWGNFGHTLQALQRSSELEVSFIYYPRSVIRAEDDKLSLHPQRNIHLVTMNDLASVHKNHVMIERHRFDVLLYLDLYMTPEMHNLAVAKLAPTQVVTHGHPVTSGIPSSIMDYFLSWSTAEQKDNKTRQSFYTEELYAIDSKGESWEYFKPRTSKNETSIVSGTSVSFSHFTRENVLDFMPESEHLKLRKAKRWYFCAQAAFKYHFTFDKILGEIVRNDPDGAVILMQLMDPSLKRLHSKVVERLETIGKVDMDRVVFVPRLTHDKLMAMYKLSDLVLDSVYFGGDTTTREAFEVGAVVITLPGKTLGQRWTRAYYEIMSGHHDTENIIQNNYTDFERKYVASTPKEYVDLAVGHAKNISEMTTTERKALRISVRTAMKTKILGNKGAAELWAGALKDIASRPRLWHWRMTKKKLEQFGSGFKGVEANTASSDSTVTNPAKTKKPQATSSFWTWSKNEL
uniref:Glycosyl transferase family 1 domain-containing protein n=1 Tax=Mantoniella antarctica TaxID=81844 RepID=A0A7S0SM75_9CHLO|mmetsp:Transcript_27133/g.67839  ORF Transcript_27133/g.67839 Transcript_27133/m.67839 type:complete len:1129 (+) Transcript_27133:188-3574(+)